MREVWSRMSRGFAFSLLMTCWGLCTVLVVILQWLMHRFPVGMDSFATSRLHITVRDDKAFRDEMKRFLEEHQASLYERSEKFLPDHMYDCDLMIRSRVPITYEQVDALMKKAENGCLPSAAFPADAEGRMQDYETQIDYWLSLPHCAGWCIVQLYDVEQEQNGIYDYWRKPKMDIPRVRQIFSKDKYSR